MTEPKAPRRKAYQKPEFLDSRDGRALRILAEYLEPEARFESLDVRNTIVFFGSARIPSEASARADLEAAREHNEKVAEAERAHAMSRYYENARELSRRLSEWSLARHEPADRYVVCTGGGPGIMEAACRGAAEAGAQSVGLTISIPKVEFENPYVSETLAFEFHYFFMRKFWFTYLAKAVVVMPGGFGTLDELFETLTLIQTLKMQKRLPIVLFGSEFWEQVLNLRGLAEYGTINAEDLDLLYRTDSVDDAFEFLTAKLTTDDDAGPGPTL